MDDITWRRVMSVSCFKEIIAFEVFAVSIISGPKKANSRRLFVKFTYYWSSKPFLNDVKVLALVFLQRNKTYSTKSKTKICDRWNRAKIWPKKFAEIDLGVSPLQRNSQELTFGALFIAVGANLHPQMSEQMGAPKSPVADALHELGKACRCRSLQTADPESMWYMVLPAADSYFWREADLSAQFRYL